MFHPRHHAIILSVVSLFAASSVRADQVNLTSWGAECAADPPTWDVQEAGSLVVTHDNGFATSYFLDSFDAMNQCVSFDIGVHTDEDNDWFGFALGLDPGEATQAAAKYLVFFWREPVSEEQSKGLRLLAVNRDCPPHDTPAGACWLHPTDLERPVESGEVLLVVKANTLGEVGYNDHQDYHFEVCLTPTNLTVYVDGTLEFDVASTHLRIGGRFDEEFGGGNFAFFNGSQPETHYTAPEWQTVPTVSEWGLVVMTLLFLTAGTLVYARQHGVSSIAG